MIKGGHFGVSAHSYTSTMWPEDSPNYQRWVLFRELSLENDSGIESGEDDDVVLPPQPIPDLPIQLSFPIQEGPEDWDQEMETLQLFEELPFYRL